MNPEGHVLQVVGGEENGDKKETKKDQPEKEKVQQESLGSWKLKGRDITEEHEVNRVRQQEI